ncbi:MAG: DUF4296 domain-containing protein [Microscillaceae bacterium]|nr:DUF4296 domain-containing protein [Microscillaceae bacterium]MDW8460933.1 DUF4296 domain-containing protein [Cytophagales bacterium]
MQKNNFDGNTIHSITLCLIIALSCQPQIEIPKNILPKTKMVDILVDLHIAEAMVMEKNYASPDSAYATFQMMQSQILKWHQVDSLTYHQSYAFYLKDMKLLDEVYAAVVDSLSYKSAIGKLPNKFYRLK